MSFSSDVKKEVEQVFSESFQGQLAELAAMVSLCGHVEISEFDHYTLRLRTESAAVARKSIKLLKKTHQINTQLAVKKQAHKKHNLYEVIVADHKEAYQILEAVMLVDTDGDVVENLPRISQHLLKGEEIKRAYIRGAFLASGSISDPKKYYHFEIVCASKAKATMLGALINSFGMESKLVHRKNHYMLYLKEGAQIVEILGLMEAHGALMELENIRIMKDMRNTVNRKVNCETANINKTVSAAMKQINDIITIQESVGLHYLEEGLEELAQLRLLHQEASLKELGELLTVPVGKSGVNHRLRKLSEIAESIRNTQEDSNG